MLSFFPRGVLDDILDIIESVSEGFPTYSSPSYIFIQFGYITVLFACRGDYCTLLMLKLNE